MQRAAHDNFEDRCIFYLSRLIHQQKLPGKDNWKTRLKEVFLIAILDFKMKNSLGDHYLQSILLVNTTTGKKFHNGLGFKFLELPKFDKKEDELENELDKWTYMLKHMHSLDRIPHYLDKRIFQKTFNIAEMGRLSAEQQFLYETHLQDRADYESTIEYATNKGIEKGLEKGKLELAVEIARKMKLENFDFIKIAGFTALSIEQIESL